jgi:hypothetical protein
MMIDAETIKVFNFIVGTLGLAFGVCLIIVPSAVLGLEKLLDKTFSTEKLEQILNSRKDLTTGLQKRPRIAGLILLIVSTFLVLTSVLLG